VIDIDLIWVERERKYFFKWDWTGKSDFARRASPLQQIAGLRKSAATSQISEWEKG
jgi:hypothetical protein